MLVLSKVYLVTKGSLVPLLVATRADGAAGRSPPASPAPTAPTADGFPSTADPDAAPTGPASENSETAVDHDRLATANAQLGLLASLTAFAASLPAIAVLEALRRALGPAPGHARLRGGDRPRPTTADPHEPSADPGVGRRRGRPCIRSTTSWQPEGPLAALGPAGHHPSRSDPRPVGHVHPQVHRAGSSPSSSPSTCDGSTPPSGTDPSSALSIAGAVVGVLVVPRARRIFSEQQVLVLAIWLVAVTAAVTAVIGGVPIQAVLAFVIGVAGGAGKPAFDALVQRYVPTPAQGRAFARFETRFQLIWVLGALLPVVASTPLSAGDIVIAAVAGVGGLSYMTGRRAVRHLRAGAR